MSKNKLEAARTAWRKARISSLPWVTPIEETGVRCEAIRLHMVSRNRPPDSDIVRCTKRAHWRFRALVRSGAKTGSYCLAHLMIHSYLDYEMERIRADDWFENHPADESIPR